jgi:cyclopropane-fatty-acyl-phospholipid synthase
MTISERETRDMADAVLSGTKSGDAAATIARILHSAVGVALPIRIKCWDDSVAGDLEAQATIVFRDPRALRRMLWSPNELGLVRAYVSGDIDFEGDIFSVLDLPEVIDRVAHHDGVGLSIRDRLSAVVAAAKLGAIGLPPAPPPEEMRKQRGVLHSRRRDASSISHHYDVGNDFYRLILGPSMVYSCAYWAEDRSSSYTIDNAQYDKLDHVCRKLGLQPGMRLLDVGCGWGSLAIHAAKHFGATVVGVTISQEQADLARQRVLDEGLEGQVEIRIQDYRDVSDGPFDAISSVGMSEHVGRSRIQAYAQILMDQLRPGGRLLNHAIASVRSIPPSKTSEPGFITSYIFPDGEVFPLSTTLDALEQVGFEVRDSEALREHYGMTLRDWVENLRNSWDSAVAMVGEPRARTWLLYLAACALAFEHGNITIHQVLAVRQSGHGDSEMPLTRSEWMPKN